MTQTFATCRRCGAPVSASEARGLCPACLLETSLGNEDYDAGDMVGIDAAWLEQQGVTAPSLGAAGVRRFGDYELFEEIGRGGMGVIYRAVQGSLKRTVAVKTILTGPLASPDFIERFQIEAHAAAVLDHPNIVPIYEVGDHQGQPYYSMPLIAGRNLAEAIKQDGPLPARQAATLIATVAHAIHYAHQRGVLHRDLKPANILLDADGQPHVTDFGLAKLLEEDDGLTLTQAALGTPNYMAPEQADGQPADLTIAADTYSLGAILFEVLTGQRLFAAATPLATINRARDQEPPRPSTIQRTIPRDLDTICFKCLEKSPGRRYATAQALAEDLERWLAAQPIRARRVGAVERLGLWCRRKPAMAGMAGAALGLVLLAICIATWRVAAARHLKELEQYSANISLADAYLRDGATDRAFELLRQCPPKLRHWEWGRLLYLCHQEVTSIPAHTNLPGHLVQSLIRRLAANHDGTRLATHGTDGLLKLWDPGRADPLLVQGDTNNPVVAWKFSPDGRQLAIGMRDGRTQVFDVETRQAVWSNRGKQSAASQNLSPRQPLRPKRIMDINYDPKLDHPMYERASAEPETVLALDYAPGGGRIAEVNAEGVITVRNAASGRELASWSHSLTNLKALWFTPDGTSLVAKSLLGFEQFEGESGVVRTTEHWDPNTYSTLFMDLSGRQAATVDHGREVQLWRDGVKTHALGNMAGNVGVYDQVWFDPAGRRLCIAGVAGKARIHDVATGRLLFSVPHNVFGAAFSHDGNRLITFGPERLVRLWDVRKQQELRVLRGHLSVPDGAAFSGDGNFIATASRDGVAKLWTGTAGRELIQCDGFPSAPTYSFDGQRWAMTVCWQGACVFDAESGALTSTFPYRQISNYGVVFSPDSRFLLTVGADDLVQVWDLHEHRLAGLLRGHDRSVLSAAFSADGRWIASGDSGGVVRIWDAATRVELRHFKAQTQFVWSVQFDPAGRKLLTAGYGPPKVWEVETGRLLRTLDYGGGGTWWATFNPDGQRIVAACLDQQIRFWDANSGKLVQQLTSRSKGLGLWGHSPDDRRLVVCVSDHGSGGLGAVSIEIWDLEHGRRLLDVQGHTDSVYGARFSPDGRRIISSAMDSIVRQWETFPWREAEYDAMPGRTLPERVKSYADRYWQHRIAAERAGVTTTNVMPYSTHNWVPPSEREKVFWPARASTTSANQINLDRHYTAAFNTMFYPWFNEYELDDDLSQLPVGQHTFGDIAFDVRGVVVLRAKNWLRYPIRAEGIRVGTRLRRLHVLHAAVGEVAVSAVIGSYVLRYADGTQQDLEIVYGRDLRHWWHGGRGDLEAEVTHARVAWTGSNPVADRFAASLRLFLRTYENPRPDAEVVSIDFVSKRTAAAPFLVAITVEP